MRKLSDTKIKAALSASDVRELAEMFVEAYEEGWRPHIYLPKYLCELHGKCTALLETVPVYGVGDDYSANRQP